MVPDVFDARWACSSCAESPKERRPLLASGHWVNAKAGRLSSAFSISWLVSLSAITGLSIKLLAELSLSWLYLKDFSNFTIANRGIIGANTDPLYLPENLEQ